MNSIKLVILFIVVAIVAIWLSGCGKVDNTQKQEIKESSQQVIKQVIQVPEIILGGDKVKVKDKKIVEVDDVKMMEITKTEMKTIEEYQEEIEELKTRNGDLDMYAQEYTNMLEKYTTEKSENSAEIDSLQSELNELLVMIKSDKKIAND